MELEYLFQISKYFGKITEIPVDSLNPSQMHRSLNKISAILQIAGTGVPLRNQQVKFYSVFALISIKFIHPHIASQTSYTFNLIQENSELLPKRS